MNATIAVVLAVLVAALAAIGLLTGDEDNSGGAAPRAAAGGGPSVAAIARRVERVRRLRFERLPRVRRVTAAQARREGLRELDREVTPAEFAGEERLLKLLGLVPRDASLRDLLASELEGQVGGFYVPRTGTLSVVGDSAGLEREVTLAHELTHALEDQRFDIEPGPSTGFHRDRAVVDSAAREGTATLAMVDYVVLKQTGRTEVPPAVRERVLDTLDDAAVPVSSGLPRYLRESLVFSYAAGARLVSRIQQRGGWRAVNAIFGRDAPVSSEQVMHPRSYDARERPLRVRVPQLGGLLPAGAAPVEQGDFGEFDTEQLLRAANGSGRSGPAAAGWGGGAFALWRLPGADRSVLVLRWVWDGERDAREFEQAVRRTARELGGATGGAAVARAGRGTALALAPDARLAQRLAAAALSR